MNIKVAASTVREKSIYTAVHLFFFDKGLWSKYEDKSKIKIDVFDIVPSGNKCILLKIIHMNV